MCGDAGWESLLHVESVCVERDRDSRIVPQRILDVAVSEVLDSDDGRVSNIQTLVRVRAGSDPASAGGAERDSNDVWPALGTTLPSMPFIRGSVVGRKAENRKTSSRASERDEEEVAEFSDELDKANFSHGKPSGSGSKGEGTCVSATKFHLMMVSDEVHEQFIQETEIKTPSEHVRDFPETAQMLPLQDDMDICSHMEYYYAQLKRFEMVDSEGEDEVNLPQMECLLENLAATLGSAKRSLIKSMEMTETQNKLKGDSNQSKN
ncbi:hypothetical protein D1007_57392 [Hordeum vulgare]|nr:hypothetical protein D1007_57392 [Hordeum vulgare]